MTIQYYEGVGRRKTSIARARVFSGDGSVICNEKPGQEYFPRSGDFDLVTAPLKVAGIDGKFSVSLKVTGGGATGQTGAAQLAIARALLKLNPDLRKPMR